MLISKWRFCNMNLQEHILRYIFDIDLELGEDLNYLPLLLNDLPEVDVEAYIVRYIVRALTELDYLSTGHTLVII